MGKLDRELPYSRLLYFSDFDCRVGLAKGEARIFTRRGAHMTNGADGRAGADHRLTREELLPMASHAGIVIGKIGDIRKLSLRVPCSWDFVTSIARQAFVFV